MEDLYKKLVEGGKPEGVDGKYMFALETLNPRKFRKLVNSLMNWAKEQGFEESWTNNKEV